MLRREADERGVAASYGCSGRASMLERPLLARPSTVQGPKGLETNRERDVRRRLHSWPCDVTRPFFEIAAHNPLTHLTSRLTDCEF